jgi:hypothetical protein
MKTVYCLRIRPDETHPWSEPEYYRTRKERDNIAATNRCLAGIRTHSYEETLEAKYVEQLFR